MTDHSRLLEHVVRWLARSTSLVVWGFVLLFLIGEGDLARVKLSGIEAVELLLFIGICLSLGLAWRWEGWGGAATVLGVVAFHLVEFLGAGRLPRGWWLASLGVPGLLFLASAWLARRGGRVTPARAAGLSPSGRG